MEAYETLFAPESRVQQMLNGEIKYVVLTAPVSFKGAFILISPNAVCGYVSLDFSKDSLLPNNRLLVSDLKRYSELHGLGEDEIEELEMNEINFVYMYPISEVVQLEHPKSLGEATSTINFQERQAACLQTIKLKNSPIVVYGSFYFVLPQIARALDLVPHNRFVEVFAGPAEFTLEKKLTSSNWINDIDPSIIEIFKLITELSEVDILSLRNKEWRRSMKVWKQLREENPSKPIDKLYRYLYLARCGDLLGKSPGAIDKRYFSKFNTGVPKDDPDGFGKEVRIERLLEQILVSRAKLQHVRLSNKDCMEILTEFKDDENTLFVCDPPYRGVAFGFGYEFDAKNIDFPKFATLLKSVKGKWIFLHKADSVIMKLFKDYQLVKFLGMKRPPFFGKKEGAKRALFHMFSNFDMAEKMRLTDRGFTSGPTTICV